MRVEHEGGAAAWLVGTLVEPIVQGHSCLCPRSFGPIRIFFFEPLVAGDQKASLASLSLCPFRHLEGCLAWGPSLVQSARHIEGPPGGGPTL